MTGQEDAIRKALRRGAEAGQRYSLAIPREAGVQDAGRRTGLRPGRSLDFRDYRDYVPGDDLRQVDWSVYARTDKLTVKLFQEELCPHADIVLDTSRSMRLEAAAKLEASVGLAAMLAVAAANARFTVSVWIGREGRLIKVPGEAARPETWNEVALDETLPLSRVMELQPPVFRRCGLRFLISDLLWPGEPEGLLRRMGEGAASVHVLHLLAEADVNPEGRGFIRVVDSETDEELDLFFDEAASERYGAALSSHTAMWADACRKMHVTLNPVKAETFVKEWTLDPLMRAGIVEGA